MLATLTARRGSGLEQPDPPPLARFPPSALATPPDASALSRLTSQKQTERDDRARRAKAKFVQELVRERKGTGFEG